MMSFDVLPKRRRIGVTLITFNCDTDKWLLKYGNIRNLIQLLVRPHLSTMGPSSMFCPIRSSGEGFATASESAYEGSFPGVESDMSFQVFQTRVTFIAIWILKSQFNYVSASESRNLQSIHEVSHPYVDECEVTAYIQIERNAPENIRPIHNDIHDGVGVGYVKLRRDSPMLERRCRFDCSRPIHRVIPSWLCCRSRIQLQQQ